MDSGRSLDANTDSILDQEVYTVNQLADKLKVSQAVIYRLLTAGELTAYKVGRGWRIPKQSVQTYLAMNTLLRGQDRNDRRAD